MLANASPTRSRLLASRLAPSQFLPYLLGKVVHSMIAGQAAASQEPAPATQAAGSTPSQCTAAPPPGLAPAAQGNEGNKHNRPPLPPASGGQRGGNRFGLTWATFQECRLCSHPKKQRGSPAHHGAFCGWRRAAMVVVARRAEHGTSWHDFTDAERETTKATSLAKRHDFNRRRARDRRSNSADRGAVRRSC